MVISPKEVWPRTSTVWSAWSPRPGGRDHIEGARSGIHLGFTAVSLAPPRGLGDALAVAVAEAGSVAVFQRWIASGSAP
jgi:hypothetical protein